MAGAEAAAALAWPAVLGLALTVVAEQGLRPRPRLARPWRSWALHAGTWLLTHGALALGLGRPWFAAAALLGGWTALVLVSHAKWRALREPFVFQDHEYFFDMLRHPRLYLPFLGWGRAAGVAAALGGAVAVGWGLESPLLRSGPHGLGSAVLAQVAVAAVLLVWGLRRPPALTWDAQADVRTHGLVACVWGQALALRRPPPVAGLQAPWVRGSAAKPAVWPHLVAVQSESFFDPRRWWPGVRPDLLPMFDRLRQEAWAHGLAEAPAWGANTVRSEFAFLSGLPQEALGGHRFQPYRAVAAGWPVPALAAWLRERGYRTVCVHPYEGSFYRRDRVLPQLGFEEFHDGRWFRQAPRRGPFVADAALARHVAALLRAARQPLFVFVITMENHGPLHLEPVRAHEEGRYLRVPLPAGCEELVAYLRHLRGADRMLARLARALKQADRPASLCWYGDHVPIMPAVYERLGTPAGTVDWFVWHTWAAEPVACSGIIPMHRLASLWLQASGLLLPERSGGVPQACGHGLPSGSWLMDPAKR